MFIIDAAQAQECCDAIPRAGAQSKQKLVSAVWLPTQLLFGQPNKSTIVFSVFPNTVPKPFGIGMQSQADLLRIIIYRE